MTDFLHQLDPVSLLSITLITATPLTLAALGGVMSERSGVVNIALEGIMLMGAFVGYGVAFFTHNLWVGALSAVGAGMLVAALHAVLSISLMVDQIVSGMVINILAVGITGVFYRVYLEEGTSLGPGTFPHWNVPFLSSIPVLGPVFFQNQFVTYAMLVLILVVHFVLFRTVWGLRTRACGEHPLAAETAGINVYFVRYANEITRRALASLGGVYFSLQEISQFFPNMSGGRGYIALAAMIFGKWMPGGAFLASLLFAAADQVGSRMQSVFHVQFPNQFIAMLPYVLTIVVVAGVMGRAIAPAADGRPYKKG